MYLQCLCCQFVADNVLCCLQTDLCDILSLHVSNANVVVDDSMEVAVYIDSSANSHRCAEKWCGLLVYC